MIVSLLLLVKNAELYLEGLLTAVLAQRHPYDLQVVAVDSGLSDATLEILARHPVRVIQIPQEDFSHGETRNLAVREADPASKYITYLSQDALPADENWLRNLTHPTIVVALIPIFREIYSWPIATTLQFGFCLAITFALAFFASLITYYLVEKNGIRFGDWVMTRVSRTRVAAFDI